MFKEEHTLITIIKCIGSLFGLFVFLRWVFLIKSLWKFGIIAFGAVIIGLKVIGRNINKSPKRGITNALREDIKKSNNEKFDWGTGTQRELIKKMKELGIYKPAASYAQNWDAFTIYDEDNYNKHLESMKYLGTRNTKQ